MSINNTPASPVSLATPPSLPQLSGGLCLTGIVIAIRTEEKEWDKEKYTLTTVSVSDGEHVFLWRHRHDDKPWEMPKVFQPVKLRVNRANTEKGQITLGGVLIQ